MTMLDSLDTLWVMGLSQEFDEAKRWVQEKLSFKNANEVSVFETTIRALGGLLGAYTLSQERVFLDRARELADYLLPAFETASGVATPWLNLQTGRAAKNMQQTTLAEVGTLQLEFGYLSQCLGDRRYSEKADRAHKLLYDMAHGAKPIANGQFPTRVKIRDGSLVGKPSWGSGGDSFYEYLLKVPLFRGASQTTLEGPQHLLEMYEASVQGLSKVVVRRGAKHGSDQLVYIPGPGGSMEHLACFVPGLLALGAYHRPWRDSAAAEMQLAEQLAHTCWQMYHQMSTGLAPEAVRFREGRMEPVAKMGWSILRPEAFESFFVLHEITGDPKYREWGHAAFEAIERHSKTNFGYGAHPDVRNPKSSCCVGKDDKQESFVLAESLKYLYLLQDPDHTLSLDTYVLNTEAHPFPLPVRTAGHGGTREAVYT